MAGNSDKLSAFKTYLSEHAKQTLYESTSTVGLRLTPSGIEILRTVAAAGCLGLLAEHAVSVAKARQLRLRHDYTKRCNIFVTLKRQI